MANIKVLLESVNIISLVKSISKKSEDADIQISVKKVGSDHVFAIFDDESGFRELTIAIVRGGNDHEFLNAISNIDPSDEDAVYDLRDALSSYTYVEF